MNTTLAITILALAGLALIIFLIASASRQRRRIEDVPPGVRPSYSDEQLEGPVYERTLGWTLVITLGIAAFFPVYGLVIEPRRLQSQGEKLQVQSIVQGEEEYGQYCATCHGPNAEGGAAAAPGGGSWPAPNLTTIHARYQDNPNVQGDYETWLRDFMHTTIERGRPGTPMPTWGAAFAGPLTDQQIEAIIDYLLANQVDPAEEVAAVDAAAGVSGEQLFANNCMRCHGEDLQGRVGPSLIGLFERHNEETILGILRNGILLRSGAVMPPWQHGYMYEDARYDDAALRRIIDYLRSQQPPDPEPHNGTIGPRDDEPAGDDGQAEDTQTAGAPRRPAPDGKEAKA